ncbi:DUF1064 domain-containing protein [Pseudophaeobacter sp. C1-32P7]|uniref:DUF1064 domain-containing protein n=1 Tax=Pseudophaeobacter sp. C1-32P7 TaxID=3098142 RepID=UPI0034D479EE
MERMSAKDFLAQQANGGGEDRRRVRGTKRTTSADGVTHDSAHEAQRWAQLRLLERAGKIRDLRRQVPFDLEGRDAPILTKGGGRTRRYIADFVYFDVALGVEVTEDAKGHDTETSELKRAIMAAMGREVVLV